MIYFIRHAECQYNAKQAQIKQKQGSEYLKAEEYLTAKFSKNYLDGLLNQNGIKQAYQCKQKLKNIHVDLILVSPLRRTLKTCQIVFQYHRSSQNAKIIVSPEFRQVLFSSNEIGSMVQQSIAQYKKFDFQQLKNPDYWYIESIIDKQIKENLLQKLKDQEDKKSRAIDITLQFLKQCFQKRQNSHQNHIDFRNKLLPSLKNQKQILLNYLKEYKSIAVVSHSQNIKSFIGKKIKNCQIYPFSKEQLQNLQVY